MDFRNVGVLLCINQRLKGVTALFFIKLDTKSDMQVFKGL
mgnify:CR=1 FL=1